MDLNRLKTFKTIVETLSYTKAAKTLCITQSAVSQQMKLLQESYGAMLVQKINNNLVLTPEGRELYQKVKSELDMLENVFSQNTKNPNATPILIIAGVQNYISMVLIPRLDHSKFVYHLDFRNASESNEGLLSGQNDIVFVSKPLSDRIVDTKLVFEEDLILVGHPDLKKSIKKSETLPMVDMNEKMVLFHKWENLNSAKIACNLIAKVTHLQGLYEFAKTHKVACLLPKHMIEKDLKAKTLVSLIPKQTGCKNKIYASILKNQKSKVIRSFFNSLHGM